MKINSVKLRIIPDSKGSDTLEAQLETGGVRVIASVPSGKSTGANEAIVLPAAQAIEKFENIKPQVLGKDFPSLEDFDNLLISLDGTLQKENLGGNLTSVLSIAFTKLLALANSKQPYQLIAEIFGAPPKIPWCFYNLIEGGVHAERSLPFQEYLLVPQVSSVEKSLGVVANFIQALQDLISEKYGGLKQGYEGGYTIPSPDPLTGLAILQEVIVKMTDPSLRLSLDVAASTLYKFGGYQVDGNSLTRGDMLSLYQNIASLYNVLSIEDPYDQEDWEGFEELMGSIGSSVWIVGDDLTTTNPERIKQAEKLKAANAVIIKPNQIGSVTESIKAAKLAKEYGWKVIVSHRGQETMDDFIADLAVGLGADGFKSGCPLQKERLIKYQRLVSIEKNLG